MFPALNELTWLNAAASSPLCTPVANAMRGVIDEAQRQGDIGFGRWLAQKEAVRAKLAAFIGAEATSIAFTPSTSFGMHVIASCLSARGVTEVLSLEHEFPSTTVPLLHHGLTVRGVRREADGSYPLARIEQALRPTTGAVAVSLVQFNSGYRVDIEGVARLCRERNLPLVINAAQALGQLPIDMKGLGASFLAATGHKWLGAGFGVGVLAIAPEFLDGLPMAGWLSVPPESMWQAFPETARVDDAAGFVAKGTRVRRDAAVLEGGGGPWIACHALEAALDVHVALTPTATFAHVQHLQRHLRAGLRRRGFVPTAPDEAHCSSGICVVPVRGAAEDAVRALQREARIVTTPRGGGLRISTHLFNTEEDLERLFHAVDRLGISPA